MAPDYKTSEEILAAYARREGAAQGEGDADQGKLPSYLSATELLKILRRSMA